MVKFLKKITFAVISLTLLSYQVFAAPSDPIKATPYYRIKAHTSSKAPNGLSPNFIKNFYGFNKIDNQGEGKTIVIVDAYDNPNTEADLAVFNSTFNLPPCTTSNGCFQKVYSGGSKPASNAEWGVEISLDVQWAHAIAPKAKIILVETPDNFMSTLFEGVQFGLQLQPDVVLMSWGAREYAEQIHYDHLFNVPNIEFIAAAYNGQDISYPASTPNVIGIGGTTLVTNRDGTFSEKAWTGSSSGVSAYEKARAYQLNFSITNNNKMRAVPDVSYIADPTSGYSVYDTLSHSGWIVVGGTSAGASQWAAFVAIAKSSYSITNVLPTLYNIAKNNYASNFNDLTTKSKNFCGISCNTALNYHFMTGIGTPKANALLSALKDAIVVNVIPEVVTLTPGQKLQFKANVTGTSNTAVTWRALGGGTITNTGLYTAPLLIGTYELLANSVVDRTKVGAAIVTVASYPPNGSNLALNKPTFASSEQVSPPHPASHATDGDMATRWCAINSRNGHWLKVDLGNQFHLTGTQVKWENSYLWKYKIEVSSDNLQWKLVVDQTNSTTNSQTYFDNFDAFARYVRITSLSNTPSQWASIYDFQVYGGDD